MESSLCHLLQENALDRKRPLIYADLGTVPLHNKPAIPPPPVDKVIYSDARDYKPKVILS